MDRISFDHHDFAALGILIGVCDRKFGRHSPVSRALHRLRDEPSRGAYEFARAAFEGLPPGDRTNVAEQARRAASESRQAFTDVQRQLNGLLGAINRRPVQSRRPGS